MSLWKIDPTHSEINFRVRHLVISTVTGHFQRFDATIESQKEDFSDAKIAFEADVESIDSKNKQRDEHLKSADFFDAASYPKISFVSTAINKVSDYEVLVKGNLTMRGKTKEITLHVIYNGTTSGFDGNKIAGFEIRSSLNRFDFGLQWNGLTEAGGVVVGNEVKIEILAEFTKIQAVSQAA